MVVLAVAVGRALVVLLPDAQPPGERIGGGGARQAPRAVARAAEDGVDGAGEGGGVGEVVGGGRRRRGRQGVEGDKVEQGEGVGPEVAAAVAGGAGGRGPRRLLFLRGGGSGGGGVGEGELVDVVHGGGEFG